MLLDNNLMFSDNQDLAKTNATYLSDKSVDRIAADTVPGGLVGAQVDDMGLSPELDLLCQVTETFTTSASGTLKAELVMADDEALTSNLTIVNASEVIAAATLVAGYQFRIAVPPGVTKQFVGCQYIIGTGAMTAGKITATLVPRGGKQTNPSVG